MSGSPRGYDESRAGEPLERVRRVLRCWSGCSPRAEAFLFGRAPRLSILGLRHSAKTVTVVRGRIHPPRLPEPWDAGRERSWLQSRPGGRFRGRPPETQHVVSSECWPVLTCVFAGRQIQAEAYSSVHLPWGFLSFLKPSLCILFCVPYPRGDSLSADWPWSLCTSFSGTGVHRPSVPSCTHTLPSSVSRHVITGEPPKLPGWP